MFKTLLLDDDPPVGPTMESYLTSLDHSVTSARSVLGALSWLDRAAFDFMVIDLPLRGQIKALALCRVLKSDPKTAGTRVLFIGGAAMMRTKAQAVGVDDFLEKPYTLDEVRSSIELLALRGKGSQPLMFGMTVHKTVEAYSKGLLGWLHGPF
jgi:CheY-like chemotaxis protein